MRRLLQIFTTLLITFLILHTLPFVARDWIVWTLHSQGADLVRLKSIRVNWFTGKIELNGLYVDGGSNPPLSITRAQADLEWSSLFQRRFHLSDARIADAQLSLEQREDGLFMGPISLSGSGDSPAETEPATDSTPLFQIGLDRVTLEQVTLLFDQPATQFTVEIDQFALDELYQWQPLSPTQIQLSGAINGAPVSIDSSALPFPERKQFSANLTLESLDLMPLSRLADQQLTGELSIELLLEMTLEGEQINLSQSGQWTVQNLTYQTTDARMALETAQWQGEVVESLNLAELEAKPLNLLRSSSELKLTALEYQNASARLLLNDALLKPVVELNTQTGSAQLSSSGMISSVELETGTSDLTANALEIELDLSQEGLNALAPEQLIEGMAGAAELSVAEIAFKDSASDLMAEVKNLRLQPRLEPGSRAANTYPLAWTLTTDQTRIRPSGQQLTITNGRVEGVAELTADLLPSTVQAQINAQPIDFSGNGIESSVAELNADLTATPDESRWNLTLDAKLQKPQLTGNDLTLNLSALGLTGPIALLMEENQPSTLSVKTTLDLQAPELQLAGQQLSAATIQVRPDLTVSLTDSQITGRADLSQTGLLAQLAQGHRAKIGSLDSSLTLSVTDKQQTLSGSLNASTLEVDLAKSSDRLKLANLSGTFTGALTPETLNLEVKDVRAKNLSGQLSNLGDLALGAASLKALRFDPEDLTLEQLELAELQLGAQSSPLARAEAVQLDRGQLTLTNATQLEIRSLTTQGLALNLVKDEQGQLNLPQSEMASDGATEPSEPSQPLAIDLQRLEAEGGLTFEYLDQTLATSARIQLAADSAYLKNFKTGQDTPAEFELSGLINDRSDFSVTGHISQPNQSLNGDWTAQVNQLALPLISPLIQANVGYQIKSGVLNLESNGTLKSDELEGKNRIRIQRLEVQAAGNDQSARTDQLFTMPLSSALSLLENKERIIDLKIPLTGQLSDPQFSYQAVIQKVLAEGVKEGAFAFLKQSLGPYGTLISLATTVAEAERTGRFIQLQPMAFAPGSAELSSDALAYTEKLADMMLQRPGLTLEICPITLQSEEPDLWKQLKRQYSGTPLNEDQLKQKLAETLLNLANARAFVVHDRLVELSVPPQRIVTCLAQTGVEEGDPRVDLAF